MAIRVHPKYNFLQWLMLAAVAMLCLIVTARADVGDELFKLTAFDAAPFDRFGYSTAISGNIAIIGSPWDSNAAADESGAAYLFDVTTGQQLSKLTASDATSFFFFFGGAVAMSGNTAVVGASADGHAGFISGSAYIFDVNDPFNPLELHKLTASDAAPEMSFGRSVATNGTTALIGAPEPQAEVTHGSAYLFDVAAGEELFKLSPSMIPGDVGFGWSVALNDTLAVVGAPFESNRGAVYLFDIATGQRMSKLTSSMAAPSSSFGVVVAISGNTVLVGAPGEDNDRGQNVGSAYVFDVSDPFNPVELHKLSASDGTEFDTFGESIAIHGNIAIVGVPLDDDVFQAAGSAYLFDVATGQQLLKLTASDADAEEVLFGSSVAINGKSALVGAPFDSPDGDWSGSAYLYSVIPRPKLGDFNSDGIVNAADYALWRDSRGQVGAGLAADGNGDELVNEGDYLFWHERFGQGAGSGSLANSPASVPEPAALLLVLPVLAAAILYRKAKSNRAFLYV